ncbi:MAG: exodeoxyribonuclease VII small subunit [Bradymonadales bacterium]|nr:MAG: exodeoxyribonuclease VII small subunit [Bradymonadales bacterium]
MSKKSEKKLPERLEEALEELEAVVEKLESPEMPLEDSLSLFERGSQLSKICFDKLQEAERKVEILLKKVPQPQARSDFEVQNFQEVE